uniref:50S ribosomal protein L19, chloroplastic n=1 Tax=Neotessella volvocina TaxID=52559 RepID=A0A3G2R021_9STRA|nr:ribosomal protein L19 [Neotessella volvocina]
MNINSKNELKKPVKFSLNLINHIESKYIKNLDLFLNEKNLIEVGDILRLGYLIPEGDKERIQYYEGIVIAKQNRGINKSFTIRRTVQGIGIEQLFLVNSPKIISITKKQSSKVRRAKLYFLRNLRSKSMNIKRKI